jgi:uracil phosphoribosyltransferase
MFRDLDTNRYVQLLLQVLNVDIETPVTKMTAKRLAGKKLAIVPILRAGLGMTYAINIPTSSTSSLNSLVPVFTSLI